MRKAKSPGPGLTSILNYRIRRVIDQIVTSPQLGFVPGRIITESTHLSKLIQAHLDESMKLMMIPP